MGSLWGVVYILRKYPICEQLSTGKTLKNPNKTKQTPDRETQLPRCCYASSALWSRSAACVGGAAWWAWLGCEGVGGLIGVGHPAGDPWTVSIRSEQ